MKKRDPKQVTIGLPARQRLLSGALRMADTVAVTYGPHGRTVMLDRMAGLLTTKDGVTVAREVGLEDAIEEAGCKVLREACIKVNDEAGDGTTTTAVLAAAIMREGHRMIVAGHDPNQIVRGIRRAAEGVAEIIEDGAVPVRGEELLRQVALVSCNGDEEVADALTEACMAVGKDGTVVIEPSERREISLVFKEGVEYPSGPSNPSFLGSNTERSMDDPLVAVIVGVLSSAQDVVPVLEEASQFPNNELILIADSIEAEALATISMNDRQGVVRCVPFGGSGLGLQRRGPMEDIAALAGATIADKSLGNDHRSFSSEWFGSFRHATITQTKAVFTAHDEAHDGVQARVAKLKEEMAVSVHEYDRDKLRERIAKLQGGMCILKVGGDTEAEIKERRARIEDALGAVQSALRHGVVAGAGSAYLFASTFDGPCEELQGDQLVGGQILMRALEAPLHRIATNAYKKADRIVERVREEMYEGTVVATWGYDARADSYRDLIQQPMVIDPAFVTLSALRAAVSVSTTLLTVEASITPKEGPMTLTEIVTVLRCLRDAVTGAKYVEHHLRKFEEQLAWRTTIADSVSKYIFTLDQYLTDSVSHRDLSKDTGSVLRTLMGMGDWSFLLSDGETTVVIRLPTHDDHETVKLTVPDQLVNAKAYHRWKSINLPSSQPAEFGPPDENGREIPL